MPAKILGGAAEVYYKPTTGQLIMRKVGLDTSSEAWKSKTVPRINIFVEKMTGKSIATACKGKKFKAFNACLRREGRKAWSGAK